jgi:hypothetical protein
MPIFPTSALHSTLKPWQWQLHLTKFILQIQIQIQIHGASTNFDSLLHTATYTMMKIVMMEIMRNKICYQKIILMYMCR